jgi:hypothetical protein
MAKTNIYAVEITTNLRGTEISRYFQTIHAARKWAKWLSSQSYCAGVRILRGGMGGEVVL